MGACLQTLWFFALFGWFGRQIEHRLFQVRLKVIERDCTAFLGLRVLFLYKFIKLVNARNLWKFWKIAWSTSLFLTRRFTLVQSGLERVFTSEAVWLMLRELLVEGLRIVTKRGSLLLFCCKFKTFISIGLRIKAAKAVIICMFMIFCERSLFHQMLWLKESVLVITDLIVISVLLAKEEVFIRRLLKFAEGFLGRTFKDLHKVYSWGEEIDLDVFQVLLLLAFLLQRTAFIHWKFRYSWRLFTRAI